MSKSSQQRMPFDEVPPESDHMWPLDLALVALGASLMYMAASRLGWENPNWLYNAKTYAIAIPAGMVLIDLVLRNFASRFMQRSLQFGFLVSMFVHLVFLILAVNVVIFARYWPDAVVQTQPEKNPVRKSLPDNLFQANPDAVSERPDWSQPVDASSEAPQIPLEAPRVARIEEVAERLEMPVQPQEQHQPRPYLMDREQPSEAQPTPSDTPSQLARRTAAVTPDMRSALEAIEAPSVPQQQATQARLQASDVSVSRSRAQGATTALPQQAPELTRAVARSQPVTKRDLQREAPRIAALSDAPSLVRRQPTAAATPALSAPAAPSVAMARISPKASRSIEQQAVRVPRRSTSRQGAALAATSSETAMASSASGISASPSAMAQRSTGDASMPAISSGSSSTARPLDSRRLASGGSRRPATGQGPIVVPDATGDRPGQASENGQQSGPQLSARGDRIARSTGSESVPSISSMAPTPLMVNAEEGPAGLSRELAPQMGVGTSNPSDLPMVSVQPVQERFRRRTLGGLTPPPSTKIASVAPFQRRLMRTAGGSAPAPAGLVGPDTEEAIERGLAFLASKQKEDGSWSLQSPGEDVLLKSDTAATALCVLAFQGAGYTHVDSDYASNVGKALDYLRQNQKPDGDLYKSEDGASNKAVWLYSHGIAALCVCEAFGMTQDPKYAEPAQRAIDFIVSSQHPMRGGWRYSPQASSDTSVTGWMMMALKSGELAGLKVPQETYDGIKKWVSLSQAEDGTPYLFRYNPYALDTPAQRHGRDVTPTMTAVGLLIRLYMGWSRENSNMQAGADYLLEHRPEIGTVLRPGRDTYYWYYATQVMFHIGGEKWKAWNDKLHPLLIRSQEKDGVNNGSWDPKKPIPDRWSPHAGRLYLTTLNLLSLEVYYRHLPIYEETAR